MKVHSGEPKLRRSLFIYSPTDYHHMANESSNSVPKRSYQVVIAATKDMGLGMDMKLPWNLPTDTKFFHDVTTITSDPSKKNATIMGRKSWEATPLEIRPLPGRLNIVLTRRNDLNIANDENVLVCNNMESALELLATPPYCFSIETVFVIGGGDLLRDYMNAPSCEAIHLTEIDISVPCDAFAPRVDTDLYKPWYSSFPILENGIRYTFNTYIRITDTNVDFETNHFSFLPNMILKRHEEFVYLDLVRDIISNGDMKVNRTGTDTLSKFGCQMRFNLRKTFPLLTTKKIVWLDVVEELLRFIRCSSHCKGLQEEGIHVGKIHGSREYSERQIDSNGNHIGQGLFQLQDVVNKIIKNPDDRRIILPLWNPTDLKSTTLPLFDMFAQYYVSNGELCCQIYQSSDEMALGVPFNIASYALLTCIVAHVCDLTAGDFIYVIGDANICSSQMEDLQEQLQNSPKPFPMLKINPQKTKLDTFEATDFELLGYDPHQK